MISWIFSMITSLEEPCSYSRCSFFGTLVTFFGEALIEHNEAFFLQLPLAVASLSDDGKKLLQARFRGKSANTLAN